MGAGGKSELELVKPESDKLEYGFVELPNGLQALLISDSETDKASAALDVRVGSLSDPKELPGLAHFLEHMLFYSNEKYPEEDAYMKFISEHGGGTNAYTASEDTNYHFDVNWDHLEPALDRFAQFFICPLISEDGVSREVNAVDSEHGKNVNTDNWRFNQVWREASNKQHPYSFFHTGNLETLYTAPTSRGVSAHEAVRKFKADKYSANLMRLCIYGRESIAELEQLVRDKFSAVENKSLPSPSFPDDAVGEEQKGILLKVVPQKETMSLKMQWSIPAQQSLYASLPSGYLSHLLGHEGEGSCFAALKAKGWATSLSAGESGDSFCSQSFFYIHILLTEEGERCIEEVTGCVLAYVRLLQQPGGVSLDRYKENEALSRLRFNFCDKLPPDRLTSALAQKLQEVQPAHALLALWHVPLRYEPEPIEAILREMTPQKLRIMWASKTFQGKTDRVEPWYGTEYSLERIPQAWLESWSRLSTHANLHLPDKNPFIPTNFALIKEGEQKEEEPRVVHSSELLQMWHRSNTSFQTPKAVVYLSFHSPEAQATPENAALTRLFVKLLNDRLNELAYDAELAGLSNSIMSTSSGFLVSFSGYNDKLQVLVQHVLSTLVNLEITPERFKVQREALKREFANARYEQPYQTAMYTNRLLHEPDRWDRADLEQVLDHLSSSELEDTVGRILRRLWVQGYASGNWTRQESCDLASYVENLLKEKRQTRPLFPSQRPSARVIQLQPGKPARFSMPVPNASNENSSLALTYQIGMDEAVLNVTAELWVKCMQQHAFHILRTQQQLGYIVSLTAWGNLTVRAVMFILQSTVYPAHVLEQRCEQFLDTARKLLEDMTDAEFSAHVEELRKAKLEKPKRLREKAAKEWREIDDGTLMFNRPDREVEALKQLQKSDLTAFFQDFVSGKKSRRKLSIHIQGAPKASGTADDTSQAQNGHKADAAAADHGENKAEEHVDKIEDIFSFRNEQALYPSSKRIHLQH